ncbi:MAG: endo-1,3-alpha-glucanase family glycosylhydrolase [Capsulimonadaceae bacterium]|nr:endo-1,3-alpha-glucanase family glycosylhydrolase [Capsulimonadaceae bacterium]
MKPYRVVCMTMAILGILAPCAASPIAQPVTSVEELPIDKFDAYQAGTFPPFPWTRIKPDAAGVDLTLRAEDESPFVGNKVTGKGLTMTVPDTAHDGGDGIERRFTPAPPGPEFLAFDFRIGGADSKQAALDLHCNLVDEHDKGLAISIGAIAGLSVRTAAGDRKLADIVSGQWYHLGVKLESGKIDTLALTAFPLKSPSVTSRDIPLPSSGAYDTLRFSNGGTGKQSGKWTIGNILMAGRVDAPRNAWWPFDQLQIDQLRASDKKVFLYYFPIYTAGPSSEDPGLSWFSRTIANPTLLNKPDSAGAGTEFEYCPYPRPPVEPLTNAHDSYVRSMEDEVRLARQLGIDGMFVDLESFPSPYGGKYFNEQAFSLMEAAARIDPAMAMIPAIYGPDSATDDTAREFANTDVVKRALAQPNILRLADGRAVITSWYPERFPASWWKLALSEVEKSGERVAFIPQFNSIDHLSEFAPISYGMTHWGPRSPEKFDWVSRVAPLTTKAIFPIVEQDVRPRGVWYMESCNSALLRGLWGMAIDDKADWAFIDTWSDYTEQAQAPSRSIGFAPFDLNAYYIQWFKTGKQPAVKRDVLYYFYRTQHTSAVPSHGKEWVLRKPWGDNKETAPRNEIELLAFLKEPGKLCIQVDGQTYSCSAGAGITSFKAPLPPDKSFTPVFSLLRGKRTVVSRPGQYAVLDKIEFGNMLYHSGVISPDAAQ